MGRGKVHVALLILTSLVLSCASNFLFLPVASAKCPKGEIQIAGRSGKVICVGKSTEDNTGYGEDGRRSKSTKRTWVKPGRPPNETPKTWWNEPKRGWSPNDSYEIPTQDPCYGIDDPMAYVECQSIPWLEGDGVDSTRTPTEITPNQAAEQVIAELDFHAAEPHFGPDRTVHEFPFDVAVGYPVWFWTSGGTDSKTVIESVGPVVVRVSVKLQKISWSLGDGTVMQCTRTTRWRQGMTPGLRSPTCGHTYMKPGRYRIVATSHWTVNWEAGGQSGSDNYSIPVGRSLEVGEIHVLTR